MVLTATAPSGQRLRRTPDAGAPKGRIFNHEMYELAFGTLYVGLMTNLLLVVATLPLVVMLMTTNPTTSWPALVLLAPLAAPAAVAAFTVFREFSADGSKTVVRSFVRAWRRHLRRSLAIGAMLAGVAAVVGLNVSFLWTTQRAGAALIPVQVVLLMIAAATALVALVAVPELPAARLRDLLRVSLLLAVRKLHLTVPALVVLSLLGSLLATRPAIALGVVASPLLFAAWGACRHALRPVLPDES